jgi:hypothetical protein
VNFAKNMCAEGNYRLASVCNVSKTQVNLIRDVWRPTDAGWLAGCCHIVNQYNHPSSQACTDSGKPARLRPANPSLYPAPAQNRRTGTVLR